MYSLGQTPLPFPFGTNFLYSPSPYVVQRKKVMLLNLKVFELYFEVITFCLNKKLNPPVTRKVFYELWYNRTVLSLSPLPFPLSLSSVCCSVLFCMLSFYLIKYILFSFFSLWWIFHICFPVFYKKNSRLYFKIYTR